MRSPGRGKSKCSGPEAASPGALRAVRVFWGRGSDFLHDPEASGVGESEPGADLCFYRVSLVPEWITAWRSLRKGGRSQRLVESRRETMLAWLGTATVGETDMAEFRVSFK